jgi:2,3,4,5-tetrahydropyridine-2-carboxylate N-succinyltransferase
VTTTTTGGAGIGLATVHDDGTLLEVWFPRCTTDEEGVTAIHDAIGGSGARFPDGNPFEGDLGTFFERLRTAAGHEHPLPRTTVRPIAAVLDDLSVAPIDATDVYLRLSLLSHRHVKPHEADLTDAFGLLANNAWTEYGPVPADDLPEVRMQLAMRGHQVRVRSVDKFPRMVDHVVPSGVRIGDADRVRLGAYLAEGTTVMHEGFVNFNAGTLGPAMIEGRISAGVVIGAGSDLGGSASVMGTLSGGGSEVIRIGEGCLVGANAGVGISLGDGCIIEAGLYVTAGTKVTDEDGEVVAARYLSGGKGLLFRRNSLSGRVEVLRREGEWGSLNTDLHDN